MNLPKIDIVFKGKAESMMKRGERGIVALLLKDEKEDIYEIKSVNNIPEDLNYQNQHFISEAFKGNRTTPLKVYAVTYTEDIKDGLDRLESLQFQYGAVPGLEEDEAIEPIALWTKECRDKKDMTIKMVLPNSKGDHEGIINFTTDGIKLKDGSTPSTSEFTARIAGLLAGTPITQSATYAVLDDVESVEVLSKDEADERVENGEFILINENNKVKVGRAITSLTTLGENKNSQWKKILIVEKMDMWKDDVHSTISDHYVGKYANTYDNKVLLITDIRLYNKALEREGILDNSKVEYNDVYINLDKQGEYLEESGLLEDGMSEEDIKKANTRDKVFLGTNLKFTDAMEDFEVIASI